MKRVMVVIIAVMALLVGFKQVSHSGGFGQLRKLHAGEWFGRMQGKCWHTPEIGTSSIYRGKTPIIDYYVYRTADVMTRRSVVLFFGGVLTLLFTSWLTNIAAFSFMSTLEHELTHGVVALLCGGRFSAITVTARKGGCAEVTSNVFVRLAPYCFPLFCIAVCCLLPFLKENVRLVGVLLAGMAYGNYLRGNFPNIGIQPDIKNSGGKLVAYPLVFVTNVMFMIGLVIVIAMI